MTITPRHIYHKGERCRVKAGGQIGHILLVSIAGCWVGTNAYSTRPLLYFFHEIEPVETEPLVLTSEVTQ